jgi:hypothetical protein
MKQKGPDMQNCIKCNWSDMQKWRRAMRQKCRKCNGSELWKYNNQNCKKCGGSDMQKCRKCCGSDKIAKIEKGKNAEVQWVRHAEMQTGNQKRRIN